GEPVEPGDAARVLDDLCVVVEWYVGRYATPTAGAPGRASPQPHARDAPRPGHEISDWRAVPAAPEQAGHPDDRDGGGPQPAPPRPGGLRRWQLAVLLLPAGAAVVGLIVLALAMYSGSGNSGAGERAGSTDRAGNEPVRPVESFKSTALAPVVSPSREQATARGVAYLEGLQQPGGTWDFGQVGQTRDVAGPNVGATALAGLTLLECDVPADDPHVRKAASVVRGAALQLTMTYAMSLSIFFLDRLGDSADEILIDSLAVRLLAGQNPTTGGWSYDCPPLPEADIKQVQALLGQRNDAAHAPKGQRTLKDLPEVIQAELKQLSRLDAATVPPNLPGDNSNSQFAALALWVARRQGIPVDEALKRINHRFHSTQNADGGWSYIAQQTMPSAKAPGLGSNSSMTCAGLLGLALSYGSSLEATLHPAGSSGERGAGGAVLDPGKDERIQRGLRYLAARMGKVQEWSRMPGQKTDKTPPGQIGGGGNLYYSLWSLERVAAAHDLKTIGNMDWYDWGAATILENQASDGSWRGQYAPGGCDTCFALLFLRRANLAPDLTAVLHGRVEDPGAPAR
ncbi:MAG TPA: hypothetical protein VJ739_02740, partial [Gemmataceae bacterium]|nr:hypothetical protein [Gemmataceae bacterium]